VHLTISRETSSASAASTAAMAAATTTSGNSGSKRIFERLNENQLMTHSLPPPPRGPMPKKRTVQQEVLEGLPELAEGQVVARVVQVRVETGVLFWWFSLTGRV